MFLTHGPCTLGMSKDGIMGKGFESLQHGAQICSVCESVLTSPQIFGSTRDG